MTAVLLSINPKWCRLIASGEKTIEVRKTRPNLGTPFKCYIYCTLSGSKELFKESLGGDVAKWNREKWGERKGMVMGEFTCDRIIPLSITYNDPTSTRRYREMPGTCLTDGEIMEYLGNGKRGHGWHISDLVIYDKPKEISELHQACEPCKHFAWCIGESNCSEFIYRAPQSWCYVEEVES